MVDRETKREKLVEPKPRGFRLEKLEEAQRLAEIEELKKLDIPDNWVMGDLGEEAYKEMEALEYGSGFLDKEELEKDEERRAEALNIEPEYGEDRFLAQIERELYTEKVLERLLVDTVTAVESDTSRFPLRTVSIESEPGEKEFLEELKTYGETSKLLRSIVGEACEEDGEELEDEGENEDT